MQNFTLGKRGISMLFFAFILLIGSSPSFGQNCPTVSDNTQDFCDALATVADLEATDQGGGISWYDNQTSTNPIPENEILENNKMYFAGSTNGAPCVDEMGNPQPRETVTVTKSNRNAPALAQGEDEFFTPCERSANDSDPNTIGDLRAGIDLVPRTGFTIEYFADQFDKNSPQLSDATVLVSGTSYFAGYVGANDTDGDVNNNSDCQSSRLPLRYEPIVVNAPAAESQQRVCEGTTLGQLEAEGTNRWYRTATSEPPLSNSMVVENGVTYYASQIIPSDGPPCESAERTPVTVTVDPAAFNESVQRFCESIGEGNDFRKPEVRDLSPSGATWFATADATEPLDPQTELIDGEDYFNRENGSECSQDRVLVDLFPTPNAGSTTQTSFCQNDEPENLVDRINDSQLGAPDQTGFFSPALSTGTNIFNPADYDPGSYTFTYTVEGNEDCPTDTSQITVTVEDAPNAGDDVNEEVCSAEANNFEALVAEFSSLLEGRDTGGTFSPTLESLFIQYSQQPIDTFTTVYTVGAEGECQDSAQISVTVIQSPNAGQDGSVELSREDAPFNLFTELEGTPDAGGTWSPGNADGSFDPATGEAGTYTYTVTIGDCSDTATVSVSFEDECPVVDNTTQSFCESIGEGNDFRKPQVSDLSPAGATWYATADSEDALPSNTELVDGTTYFAGNSQGTCNDRPAVLVNIDNAPNAGSTTALAVCSNDAPFDVLSRYNPSILGAPDTNGTFSPAFASGTTIFDPAVDAAGTYTYTVQSENDACPDDTSVLTITITNVDAGEDGNVEVSREDAPFNLFNELNGTPMAGGTWSPGNADGSFNPATGEQGTYTYTVTNGSCTDTANVNVIILEENCPVVDNTTQSFCESIGEGNNFRRPQISDLMPAGATWYATADSEDALASNTELVDGTTYFAGNSEGTCNDRTPVLVNLDRAPNAGRTTAITICSNDAPFDLVSRINNSILGAPDAGGTFSPALASGTTIFDPAVDVARTYTYTVQSENDSCPADDAVITVNITNVNAGENGAVEVSREDAPFNLFTELNGTPMTGGTWSPGNADGSFDPATGEQGTYTYTVTNGSCTDTATVTVTITEEIECPVVADNEQAFCASIGEGNNSRRPRVSDLMPTNATWYATATSTEALAGTTVLVDGEDYFAGNPNANCTSRERVVVSIDQAPNAGRTTSITVCRSDVAFDLVSRINESILGAPDAGGTFIPALASGTTIFDPAVDVARTYTYRVESENDACPADDAVITVNITNVNAGENGAVTVSRTDTSFNLFTELNGTPMTGGTWSPGNADGTFIPATGAAGTYTYTVTSGSCTATATVTVTFTDEPICPVVTDNTQAFCESIEVGNNSRRPRVSDLMPANATWYETATSTTPLASTTALINGEDYFAGNENATCSARPRVVVTLDESPNAGRTTAITVCSTDAPFDLVSRINESILGAPDAGGTFTPALASGTTIFNPAVDVARAYIYRVESSNDACPADTSQITVNINTGGPANAGTDVTATYCVDENTDVQLSSLLSAGASTNGTFSAPYANGIFNPSTAGEGEYEITYTVGGTTCITGTDTATITITVTGSPDAPVADAQQSFCIIDSPTVADLEAEGENVVWYTDAAGTTVAPETTALTNGAVFYAISSTGDSECETSDAVMVTVTLNDSVSPTIPTDGNEFCRQDNPTIQNLINNLSGTAINIYSSATGGTAIPVTTTLQNGTIYYATSTSTTTGCESSERRAVNVKVLFCGIPEGFSPNGDGINDRFVIEEIATDYPNYTIEIFNRWGNAIYKGNASTPDWDGISNQSTTIGDGVLPAGVYFYILNYNDGQTDPVQGKLYLSR